MSEHVHELLIDTHIVDYIRPSGIPVSEIFVQCIAEDCEFYLTGNEIIIYLSKVDQALDALLRDEYSAEEDRVGGLGISEEDYKKQILEAYTHDPALERWADEEAGPAEEKS